MDKQDQINQIEARLKDIEIAKIEQRLKTLEQRKIEDAEPSFASRLGKSFAQTGRNLASGVLELPDLLATPVREGINFGLEKMGSKKRLRPASEVVSDFIDERTSGLTKPTTSAEKVSEAVVKTIASFPGGLGMGNALKAAKYAKPAVKKMGATLSQMFEPTVANTTSAAVGSAAAQAVLNDDPHAVVLPLIAGVSGGVGTAGAFKALQKNALANAINNSLKVNAEKLKNFEQAQLPATLGDISDRSAVKMTQNLLEKLPFVGSKIEHVRGEQFGAINDLLRSTDAKSDLGNVSLKGAKAYRASKNKTFREMKTKIDHDLNAMPDREIEPKQLLTTLTAHVKGKTNTPLMQEKFQKSALGKNIKDALDGINPETGKIPLEHLQMVYHNINDQITTHGLIGKQSQGQLKHLAKNINQDITRDLSKKFKALGQDSYKNWKDFNRLYHLHAKHDIAPLNELLKTDKESAVKTFLTVAQDLKKGGKKAQILMEALEPEERATLSKGLMQHLGADQSGKFQAGLWHNRFSHLDKDAQQALLSAFEPEHQQKIFALNQTLGSLKETAALANHSKTEYYHQLADAGKKLGTAATALSVGNLTGFGSVAVPALIAKVAAQTLASPKVISWLGKAKKLQTSKQFLNEINKQERLGVLPKALLQQATQLAYSG